MSASDTCDGKEPAKSSDSHGELTLGEQLDTPMESQPRLEATQETDFFADIGSQPDAPFDAEESATKISASEPGDSKEPAKFAELEGDWMQRELELLMDSDPAYEAMLEETDLFGDFGDLEDIGGPAPEAAKTSTSENSAGKSSTTPKPMKPSPSIEPPPMPPGMNHGSAEEEYSKMGDKMSRFMRDPNGNLLPKWKADYAKRDGGGRAQCRDTDCLERHEQGGMRFIDKGCLRIGRRIVMKGHGGDEGQLTMMWFHARCIFNSFTRARKDTRIIKHHEDIEGFESLEPDDQALLLRIISGTEDVRQAKFGTNSTPQKRATDAFAAETPAAKRRREKELPPLKAGDRVWTHFRTRVRDEITKSPKPELAQVVSEPDGGFIVVQFESEEHEKTRIERIGMRRFKRTRAWFRFPRIFEGKKQRIPVHWMVLNRPPPRLCGCSLQEWGHKCIEGSCSRSANIKVWGVGQ